MEALTFELDSAWRESVGLQFTQPISLSEKEASARIRIEGGAGCLQLLLLSGHSLNRYHREMKV